MPGVTIGSNVVIGAGSLVNKDIPSGWVAAGNPAKPIMTVEDYYKRRVEAQLKEEEIQNRLREIEAKGEQDRQLEELKFQHEMALKYVDVDMSMLAAGNSTDGDKIRISQMAEENKRNIEQQRVQGYPRSYGERF